MYTRFSHNSHSVTSLLSVSEAGAFAYVRKVFAQFPFRDVLTYCFGSAAFAYARKVFAQFPFRNFLTYCIGNVCFAYVRKICRTSMGLTFLSS